MTTDMSLSRFGRGLCPVCGRDIALTKAGKVRTHGAKSEAWPPVNCDGSSQDPKEN